MATRDTTDGREDETDISSQGGGARVGDYLISDVSAHVQSRPVIQSRRAESCGDDDDAMHPRLYTSGVRVCVCIHIMRSLPVTPVPRWTRMTFPFSRVYLLTCS